MLDFSPLEKAVNQLSISLEYCQSPLAKKDDDIFYQFRQSAIQAFEYTYELSIKMIRRQLEEVEVSEIIDRMSYRELIRTAAEKGLLKEPKNWFSFREMRNITSNTYDENKAALIYQSLPGFLQQAKILLIKLQEFK